jgi:hypothetical protein
MTTGGVLIQLRQRYTHLRSRDRVSHSMSLLDILAQRASIVIMLYLLVNLGKL